MKSPVKITFKYRNKIRHFKTENANFKKGEGKISFGNK